MWYGLSSRFLHLEIMMHKMLELTLADGKELDIPAGAVVMFEEMNSETNPNFPSARAFLTYVMGNELRTAITSTKFEDLMFELEINTQPGWLRLTQKETGLRVILLSKNVVGRLSLEDGCEVSYVRGEEVRTITVNESRREIKKWSERAQVAPPAGLIPLPVPAGAE